MKTTSTTSRSTGIVHILNKPSSELLTNWYAEQVVKGNIIAAEKVILAAKRHLNDLKRAGTEGFPYVFNEEKAHRPIKFIEKYCKPSKGNFKQLILQPWQHFILGSLFGWVHKETGLRRFKEGLIFVGRKNGKTTLISGVSVYGVSKDDENGADIPLLANSMKQARLLFDEAKAMIKASPKLKKRFRPLRDAIHFDKTFSKIEPQASDSEKLDGLNTHIGIFDEIHEYKHYKLINVVKNSRGAREQPLLIYITTAGYQLDGPLVNYYEQGTDVLNGVYHDERTFYFLAELDDEKEFDQPEMWVKANPNMGVSIKLSDMVEDWEKAKRTPSERNDFITKRFNIFVNNSEESFLDYETIKKNNKERNPDDIVNIPCVGGFDLSDSEDFTSACLEFPIYETGEVFILSHTWVPERKVLLENEKIPFREYEKLGLLTIIPGDYVKKEYIYDWFVMQSKVFAIEKIMYDPAKAFGLVEAFNAYGFVTESVRQGFLTLGPAVDDVKERFIDGNVIYNNNRLFRWYVNNVKMIEDRNRNKLPQKQGRYRKIDGFAAFLNAHTEIMKKLAIGPQEELPIEEMLVRW
ncbi:Phage terminase-like protein, large subunit [Paenibacillus larvae subsp. larvae]|uniref:Phage terminase-like protein, large subunit n=1 Tax=Paenibacillus larvae subsp. larvae TaxID=147375 RepID=A0A2L1TWV2_9BACL|nr:terminase large subunit [Paenibacillus larvae]AQT85686.1 terminase [Paenibacillus larvae subsp. pulvifaciens]AVF25088.1 Phage terminase-like protein, large subunit [Paenibacillus larvae subsp. larvae]AVF29852.1 Phage terminase-like protein, large subunit [Paenibacillus larvae subsp. larvae]MBH0342275.1 terminase [Paenibacillus larvae]MCY7520661.1 terminase large subunit [Paenibacillus larvae]